MGTACQRWLIGLVITLALASVSVPARAGGMASCGEPFIFPGSAANIVALEYKSAVDDPADRAFQARLRETARQLSWLTKMGSWHAPTYGSLGVISYLAFDRPCEADEVRDMLLDRRGGALETLRQNQALVVLSGRIYREGDRIFIQSFLQGLRRGEPGEILPESLRLEAGALGADQALETGLPLLTITFEPRELSMRRLERIQELFTVSSALYAEPDPTAPATPLDFDTDQPMAFSVRLHGGGHWLEAGSHFTGQKGFIRIDPRLSNTLNTLLPELEFVNGLLGYLRIRQGADSGYPPAPRGSVVTVRRAFERFVTHPATANDTRALALAESIMGILEVIDRPDALAWGRARERFKAAVETAPFVSTHRMLLAMAETRLCCVERNGPSIDDADPVGHLVNALSVEPQSRTALANLDGVFGVLEARAAAGMTPPGIDVSELSARRAKVQALRTVQRRADLMRPADPSTPPPVLFPSQPDEDIRLLEDTGYLLDNRVDVGADVGTDGTDSNDPQGLRIEPGINLGIGNDQTDLLVPEQQQQQMTEPVFQREATARPDPTPRTPPAEAQRESETPIEKSDAKIRFQGRFGAMDSEAEIEGFVPLLRGRDWSLFAEPVAGFTSDGQNFGATVGLRKIVTAGLSAGASFGGDFIDDERIGKVLQLRGSIDVKAANWRARLRAFLPEQASDISNETAARVNSFNPLRKSTVVETFRGIEITGAYALPMPWAEKGTLIGEAGYSYYEGSALSAARGPMLGLSALWPIGPLRLEGSVRYTDLDNFGSDIQGVFGLSYQFGGTSIGRADLLEPGFTGFSGDFDRRILIGEGTRLRND